jgi:glycosyltransferase involved in cell wall biosynthesis
MNILFLTRTLNSGGAERQLVNLAKGLKNKGHKVTVGLLYDQGVLKQELDEVGVAVLSFDKKSRWDVVGFFRSMFVAVNQVQPQVVYAYGSVPNILTIILKLYHRKCKMVWGIRASYLDLSRYDRLAKWVYKAEIILSRFADSIVINSQAGADYATKNGLYPHNVKVIYNGISTSRFQPDKQARDRLRKQWNIAEDVSLIGLVGRLDLMKDHPVFIQSIAAVIKKQTRLMAICIGDGDEHYRDQLKEQAMVLGVDQYIIWERGRTDIPDCMNAFDVFVSSSYGEGFPNVIGEAMACGIPCVVTDVGDSANVVSNCGKVVAPKNSRQLADAVLDMLLQLQMQRQELSNCCRNRIVNNFGYDRLIDESERHLEGLLTQ